VEFIRRSYPVHFQPKEGPSDFQWVDELPVTQRSFDRSGSVKSILAKKAARQHELQKSLKMPLVATLVLFSV